MTGIPADRAPLYRSFEQALGALKGGEVDAVRLTSLTTQNLVDGEPDLEATPQFYPVLDGVEVKGYGASVFRKEDQGLRDAIDQEPAEFVGSDAHWALVEPFGFAPTWRRIGRQKSFAQCSLRRTGQLRRGWGPLES